MRRGKPMRFLKLVLLFCAILILPDTSYSSLESKYVSTSAVTVVGDWTPAGYFILDGPIFDREIFENIWIDRDVKYVLTEEGLNKDRLRFHEIVFYEIIRRPNGVITIHFLLNRYPGVWRKAPLFPQSKRLRCDVGYIYGPRFW